MIPQLQSEFSRPFDVAGLRDEAEKHIEASDAECADLARRLSVESVKSLSADLRLTREMGAVIRLQGCARVTVVQHCVVTLSPIESDLRIEIDRRFGPPEMIERSEDEDITVEDEDPPDPIGDGVIDLGEVVAELVALEIDPFPRADGVEFTGYESGGGPSPERQSPFAVLEGLVKKQK